MLATATAAGSGTEPGTNAIQVSHRRPGTQLVEPASPAAPQVLL